MPVLQQALGRSEADRPLPRCGACGATSTSPSQSGISKACAHGRFGALCQTHFSIMNGVAGAEPAGRGGWKGWAALVFLAVGYAYYTAWVLFMASGVPCLQLHWDAVMHASACASPLA